MDLRKYSEDVFRAILNSYSFASIGAHIDLKPHFDSEGSLHIKFQDYECSFGCRQDEIDKNKSYMIFDLIPPTGGKLEDLAAVFNEKKSSQKDIERYVRKQKVRQNSGSIVVEWELKRFPNPKDFAGFIKGHFISKFMSAALKLKFKQ